MNYDHEVRDLVFTSCTGKQIIQEYNEHLTQSHGSARKFRPVTFPTSLKIASNEITMWRPEVYFQLQRRVSMEPELRTIKSLPTLVKRSRLKRGKHD